MSLDHGSPSDYHIASDRLPGLSKVVEETGESTEALTELILFRQLGRLGQVAGKIIGLGHMGEHWDGTVLKRRLEDEIADLRAAMDFFEKHNGLDGHRMDIRRRNKLVTFEGWRREQNPDWAKRGPVNCNVVLQKQKAASWPRTCARCGLGPCPFYTTEGEAKCGH